MSLPWTLLHDSQTVAERNVSILLRGQEQVAQISILSMMSAVIGQTGQFLSVKHSQHKDARMAMRNIMTGATSFIHGECCLKMLYRPVSKRGPPW